MGRPLEAFPASSPACSGPRHSISYGIGTGFIVYCLVKLVKGRARDVHPILWVASLLFVLNFVLLALL